MIKLLSKKIIASICLVLTVFAVSTSVLATDYELPASLKHVTIDTLSDFDISEVPNDIGSHYGKIDYSKYLVIKNRSGVCCYFMPAGYNSFVVLNGYNKYSSTDDKYVVITLAYDSSNNTFKELLVGYKYENGVWIGKEFSIQSYDTVYYTNSNCKLYYSTSSYFDSAGNSVSSIEPGTLIADFESLNRVSTDFNYKLEAESKDRLALAITDLDSSYKMIGFVDNPTIYEVGDVLSAGIDIAYQRITPRRFR